MRHLHLLVFALAACPRPQPAPEPPVTEEAERPSVVPQQLRRLSNDELLAGATALAPAARLPKLNPDPLVQGFDNDARALVVSEQKFDDLLAIAEVVSNALTNPPPCAASDAACQRATVAGWVKQGWGRPATDDELDRLLALGDTSTLALAAQAIVLSPSFVYRTEFGSGTGPTPHLTQLEVAQALSFAITGARPDELLIADALAAKLLDPDVRVAHARRLFETPVGRTHARDVLKAWLGVRGLIGVPKDGLYDLYTIPKRASLERELDAAITDALFDHPTSVKGLLTRPTAWPDELVQSFYTSDLLGPPNAFSPVAVDPSRRRGVLTMPGFLSRHSNRSGTTPVHMGVFLKTQLLCQEVPPPPPDVLANTPPTPAGARTTRERLTAHAAAPRCQGCHRLFDSLGFAFEGYDHFGRARTMDNGVPVDASGTLMGTDVDGPFTGAPQLIEKLGDSVVVRRCVAQQLWRASVGRPIELPEEQQVPIDEPLVDLFLDVVRSDRFVTRTRVTP
ncbi:MAG: DUF1588 domain-containing protein [Archangium sp.]|nr:DUF1588 domain-containing protein [Archangium sp.]